MCKNLERHHVPSASDRQIPYDVPGEQIHIY